MAATDRSGTEWSIHGTARLLEAAARGLPALLATGLLLLAGCGGSEGASGTATLSEAAATQLTEALNAAPLSDTPTSPEHENAPFAPGAPTQAELEARLMSELARLGVDISKAASKAPQGEENVVFDLTATIVDHDGAGPLEPVGTELSWTAVLAGDFNLDGTVSIQDITPLGRYFGRQVAYDDPALHNGFAHWPAGEVDGAGAENWRLAQVDGNRDGLINLSDITTIAQHWKESLTAYHVHRNIGTGFTPGKGKKLSLIPRAAGRVTASGRRQYSIIDIDRRPLERIYWVAEYHEQYLFGPFSTTVTSRFPDLPPKAVIEALDAPQPAPQEARFSAKGSVSEFAEIAGYAWDWNSDGVIDHDSGLNHGASHRFESAGSHSVSVIVTDSAGQRGTASVSIEVQPSPYLWTQGYPAEINAIASDSSGNLLLAGIAGLPFEGPAGLQLNPVWLIVKTDSTGIVLWERTYAAGHRDSANGIAADGAGNIYVAGTSEPAGGVTLPMLLKLDAQGKELWSDRRTIDDDEQWSSGFLDCAVLPDGRVLAVGLTNSHNSEYGSRGILMAYSEDGQLISELAYADEEKLQLQSLSFSQGRLYLLSRGIGYLPQIICTETDGSISWQRKLEYGEGKAAGSASICCSSDSVYFASTINDGGSTASTLVLSAFSSDGETAWLKQFAPGSTAYDCALAWHPDGHLIVAGSNFVEYDYLGGSFWLELNADAELQAAYNWITDFAFNTPSFFCIEDIAVSASGQTASIGRHNSDEGVWENSEAELSPSMLSIIDGNCQLSEISSTGEDPGGESADWQAPDFELTAGLNSFVALHP